MTEGVNFGRMSIFASELLLGLLHISTAEKFQKEFEISIKLNIS